jgi:hypothetical protein
MGISILRKGKRNAEFHHLFQFFHFGRKSPSAELCLLKEREELSNISYGCRKKTKFSILNGKAIFHHPDSLVLRHPILLT